MRINQLALENFRQFEAASFNLGEQFTLLIGENATGKTSILDAIAVGLGGFLLNFPHPAKSRSIHRDEVRLAFYSHGDVYTAEPQFPVSVICKGQIESKTGIWRRELSAREGRTNRQDLFWIRDIADSLKAAVKAGQDVRLPIASYYGTGRLWLQRQKRKVETLKPQSRFIGYQDCLNPASDEKGLLQWFKTREMAAIQRNERSPILEACRRAILSCIPEATGCFYDVARDSLILRIGNKEEFMFHYLSDGYRNVLAMVADIAVRCATLNPGLGEHAPDQTPGVVLIDEIDLHLHPKWQRRVVGDLVRTFPNIQFIATTHSPFVIQSLPPSDNVALLNLDSQHAEDYRNKSIEDITEEVQGVDLPQRSRRYQEMMQAAEEYYRCLQDAESADQEELERLKKRLDELSLPFSDDPAYQALLLSERKASGIDREDSK